MTHCFNLLAKQYPSVSAGLHQLANSNNNPQAAEVAQHFLEFFEFYLPLVPPLFIFGMCVVLSTSSQVRDYGVCLCYNDFNTWFLYYRRLFLVFLGLAPKGQYARSCLLHLHLLNHWKEHNFSVFQHLEASIYSFNVAVGEMTFAQLAWTVLGDTDQSSMTKLREAYQAQPYVGAVTPECKTDTHSSTADFPMELQVIQEHLQMSLVQIKHGLWWPYQMAKGTHLVRLYSEL